ncbi:MAG: nuclear transport factor 2 family protein [Rhodospirillales bacterium]|nr:MAG: nuclear transport factor 2 family protein [Rhodospirillales bacterium]
MADNGAMVVELDKRRMDAMGKKDVATLKALIADDLIYTHSSARIDTKASLIGAMESGATVYTAVEPSDVVAQDLGDAVVLTGTARIGVVSNGAPNAFSVRFMDVYAKRGGNWQMVAWQSTRLPA